MSKSSRWDERLGSIMLSCLVSQLTPDELRGVIHTQTPPGLPRTAATFSSRSITAIGVIDRATSKPTCSRVNSSITLQILKGFALVVAIELEVQCPHVPRTCRWLRTRRWHRQAPLLTSFARQDPQTLLAPQVIHHITATGKTSWPGLSPKHGDSPSVGAHQRK